MVFQGIQTPLEVGTGQKPLSASDIPPVTSQPSTSQLPNAVSVTSLQQLPGHEKRPIHILDKFKGNDQYQQAMSAHPAQDSVKVSFQNSQNSFLILSYFYCSIN